nr:MULTISPECIES: ATP-binding protein [unclassified Actinomyces]
MRRIGARRLNLDEFYSDGTEPGMPLLDGEVSGPQGVRPDEAMSRIDWDHPASWDAERAMAAIRELCAAGGTRVPVYSLPDNATRGHRDLDIGQAPVFVAEEIFASELVERCRAEGLIAEALVLRRPRAQTWWFRLRRDLSEHRKPLPVLLTRGLRLARSERERIDRWVAQGCRPVSRREREALTTRLIASPGVPEPRADGAA